MKKIFIRCFVFIVFCFGFIIGLSHVLVVNLVNAQSEWGPSCPNATYPNNNFPNQCPAGQPPVGGALCSTASNFNVTIDGNIPVGQKFLIDIEPVNGELFCSDVTCLKRNTQYTSTEGYNGSEYKVTLDQIGCSGSVCDNNYKVTAVFAQPYKEPGVSCGNPTAWTGLVINGRPNDVHFTIFCEYPTSTPTPSPSSCPVPSFVQNVKIDCPYCQ